MAQFKAFAADVEVNGETVLSIVEGMGNSKEMALSILAKHGIANPQPGQWYAQQSWLDAFKTIAESIGENTLFAIGRKIPEKAQFPPAIDNIEKALAAIDIAYHMNHRIRGVTLFDPSNGSMKEGIGHYTYEKIDGKSARMLCKNPYPCDFDRGIIEAMGRRFKPKDSLFLTVAHDDSQPCRKKGSDTCTYHVSW